MKVNAVLLFVWLGAIWWSVAVGNGLVLIVAIVGLILNVIWWALFS